MTDISAMYKGFIVKVLSLVNLWKQNISHI